MGGFQKSDIIKKAAAIVRLSGLHVLMRSIYGGRGVILMFHSLTDQPQGRINQGGVLDVRFFEKLLQKIKDSDLEPIRLSQLPERLESGSAKRFVCFSFDDGYKDNLSLMAPLAAAYQIPVTVFVTSGGMMGELSYEWGGLAEYIRHHDHIAIGNFEAPLVMAGQKQMAYRAIARLYLEEYDRWQPLVHAFLSRQKIDLKACTERDFMGAGEVRQLSQNPMIEIGGHTLTHPMLSHLSTEEALTEIVRNRADLQKLTGQSIDCFAYPYGGPLACGAREFDLARQAGYKLAVTTQTGMISTGHKRRLHDLPRINVSGAYETPAMIDLYLSGGWSALRSLVKSGASVP